MNLGELRDLSREQLQDTLEPYFCVDAQLNAYLNEAEREASIRAKLIYDAAVSIPLVADRAVYALDAQFFLFDRFALGGTNTYRALSTVTIHQLDAMSPGWEDAPSSTPEYVLLDQAPQQLRLWPTPSAALAGVPLRLRGFREPLNLMEDDSDTPEIAAIWHEYLVDWVRYRFYTTHDADMRSPELAAHHLALFERRFGVRPDAGLHTLMARRETLPVRPKMMFGGCW